ncbi:glycosyltransferase [Marisediminicola senii]|uniref:glycosyltransferase n=1 Tax=Marisediminicola senii TaxID=2711233 RepID=UPI0013EE3CBF|nr:glycosyltransferase family A protein [Marisediminicola senii]
MHPRESGSAIDELVVVVPVNDEEALLAECLDALRVATTAAATPGGPVVRIVAVLDNCVDRSAAIAAESPGVETVVVAHRNVGAARADGVAHAMRTSGARHPSRLWIANTDADSRVPADWVTHQLELAASGTTVMLGSVTPDPRDLTPFQYAAWRQRHDTDDSGVARVHGANLGIRADAYLAAGGFPSLPEHEDVLLAKRVDAAAVVTAGCCHVVTSARTDGRTPGGYSAYVRENY